jgi:hypothetical protein
LALTLGGIHLGLASLTKTPELQLEDSESKALAYSIANVMEQFDMSPDPRFVAVGGLITTCASIYGPRAYLIRERRKEEKKPAKNDIASNVTVESNGNVVSITDPAQFNFSGN